MSGILYHGNPVLSSRKDCKNPLGLGVLQTKSANFAVRGSILRGFSDSGTLQTPTSESGFRTHSLSNRRQKKRRKNKWQDGERTFSDAGTALPDTPSTRCAIPSPPAGIASGFDVKSLSEILGHSDVTTTLRCYVHPSIEQKRRQMETLFDGKIRGRKYGQ